MRTLGLWTALVASGLLTACILGEAQKIDGGAGAGGAGSTATSVSATSGPGGGGQGGGGGMPPTCTSDSPGSVEWVVQFGEESAAGGGAPVADQRVTQLAVVPDGVLALGQHPAVIGSGVVGRGDTERGHLARRSCGRHRARPPGRAAEDGDLESL